jgi:putative transposase
LASHGRLEVSDTGRLKSLEDENAKLKKLLAEAMPENAMLSPPGSERLSLIRGLRSR